jgi:signal peptidase I
MKFDSFFFKKQLPVLLSIVILIMAIRSSVIEPFRIPTRSMIPGLLTGDFLFANKFQYGFHVPFSETFANAPIYLGETKNPKRGDVIIFTPPEAGQESLYIKRVVGLPGDKIKFLGKQFYLNGQLVPKVEITGDERNAVLDYKGFDPEDRYQKLRLHLFHETIDDHTYTILEDDTFEALRNEQELTVPENSFFVLGDNRDDTRDSRVFGVISFNSIRGHAFVIWFSYRISMADSHWSFRPERIGKVIR